MCVQWARGVGRDQMHWGLAHTLIIAATQPCREMTWGAQNSANAVPGQAPCKWALHSSVLLSSALGTCTPAVLGPPSGTLANELQGFSWHLGWCVMWSCSSHMLERQASLCNLKLLAEMVGYGVSALVIKFFHSEREKFSPPYSAKGVQWAQCSNSGRRTSWCVAVNQTNPDICIWHLRSHAGTVHWVLWVAGVFSTRWHCARDTGTAPMCVPSHAWSPWLSCFPVAPWLPSDSHPNHSPASLAHHVF